MHVPTTSFTVSLPTRQIILLFFSNSLKNDNVFHTKFRSHEAISKNYRTLSSRTDGRSALTQFKLSRAKISKQNTIINIQGWQESCCFDANRAMSARWIRICASLGLRMKLKTLFMSDKEKHGHLYWYVDCRLSKQFLAPVGWVLSVFKLVSCKHGASRELAVRPPRPEKL